MHQKIAAILTLFTIGFLTTPTAQASSVIGVVQPNQPVKQGLQFNVTRKIDKNPQQYQFTIEIIPQNTQLPEQFSTSLSLHHVTSHGESIAGLRAIPCEQRDRHILCNFTVPIKATQNPELVFLLDVPVVIQRNGRAIAMPSSK
jgi:hypothetical protein